MIDKNDLGHMNDLDVWKMGYGKVPGDFNSIEEVDAFFTPLIECLNERITICPKPQLKGSIEWERDSLIRHKELLRNLLNPFYVRELMIRKKSQEKVIPLYPHI